MHMNNLIITFRVMEQQQQLFKDFCADKMDCDQTITVAQNINSDKLLFLSTLIRDPNIRFGVY